MARERGDDEAMAASKELVFAVCHELGNLLAGVRLEADLLEPHAGAEELAKAGRRIENASARAGSLLALVPPLLAPESVTTLDADPLDVLDGLFAGLDGSSEGRVHIELKSAANLPRAQIPPEVLYHLMLSAIFCGLEAGGDAGLVRALAAADGDGVAFVVIDQGRTSDGDGLVLHGRPLVFAIAGRLLSRLAARFETAPCEEGTRVAFIFPAARG